MLIYLLLRLISINFEKCTDILRTLGLLNIKHSWILIIIDEDDICVILRDKRGYKRITFYDNFPELEQAAKGCSIN